MYLYSSAPLILWPNSPSQAINLVVGNNTIVVKLKSLTEAVQKVLVYLKFSTQVNIVDIETHELVHQWCVYIETRAPHIEKTYQVNIKPET